MLNPGGMETPEVLKGRSAAAIDMVGCSNTESAALLKCLQALPAALLVNTTHTFEASVCQYHVRRAHRNKCNFSGSTFRFARTFMLVHETKE